MLLAFLTVALVGGGVLAVQEPKSVPIYLKNLPSKIYYFEDTSTVLYHDAQDSAVHVSEDEGKTWKPASGIPAGQAKMLVEHPFDNTIAFILSEGETHWRTTDRGQTWRTWKIGASGVLPDLGAPGGPLSFHVKSGEYSRHAMLQGISCKNRIFYKICSTSTYYTTDLFESEPKLLLPNTRKCMYAHSSKEFKHSAPEQLVFCIAFDPTTSDGEYTLASARLMQSNDYFKDDKRVVDLGLGGEKNARGVVALAVNGQFAVVARRELNPSNDGMGVPMHLHVSSDLETWALAKFPHASSAMLRENAYTILTGTTHSLAVDVLLSDHRLTGVGTLFVSNSNGTFFTESLRNTNRNTAGFVDFETVYGLEGVALANIVANADTLRPDSPVGKALRSKLTFDDGRTWFDLKRPEKDVNGQDPCHGNNAECNLHLQSVTQPHNFGRIFSSPAPGFVMGVGNVGSALVKEGEGKFGTFLSTDGGQTWKHILDSSSKYEFGGFGTVLAVLPDDLSNNGGYISTLRYSLDEGNTWQDHEFKDNGGEKIEFRPRAIVSAPDSTSMKFLVLGTLKKQRSGSWSVSFWIDFKDVWDKQCTESDFEKWYARSGTGRDCVMGHKQYYKRRKAGALCYVGHKFEDPEAVQENCDCVEEDWECDYNFIRQGEQCVPAGPLPIESDACKKGTPDEKYMGSSGWRKIPGNTCQGGVDKSGKVERECRGAQPKEGEVISTSFEFPAKIRQNDFFRDSATVLVLLDDGSLYQSSNEGYSWRHELPDHKFLGLYMHPYSNDRAYLVAPNKKVYYTVNKGQSWDSFSTPTPPNIFRITVLAFHPTESDWLIWTGSKGACDSINSIEGCSAQAQYSRDNGKSWHSIDDYVRTCQWARDKSLKIDTKQIMCESYKDKKGDQRLFRDNNPLRLISGTPFYESRTVMFDQVVGFAKFAEYMLVAEYLPKQNALDLQVSLDGKRFSTGMFPPAMRPDNHAYTILESSTDSVFLHLTTSDITDAKWGNILKSNSNGTYYSLSVEGVSRNNEGYVDFEKMIGLDGIVLINVVGNPGEAAVTRKKQLQTRISHNDGGTWKPLTPPAKDALGQQYKCKETKCALHIHGFTERYDVRATYSSPAIPGVLMAVGSVGEYLAPYAQSDTFLSRDGGFTWEEIHKDAHLWEFGDSGALLVIANDEEPTDVILYSTDEGLSWKQHNIGRRMRVLSIRNAPSDTSRNFILFGHAADQETTALAVHVNFESLTSKKCVLDLEHEQDGDFELWSPSEHRDELCLFGRTVEYHRRKRTANCFVGDIKLKEAVQVKNCTCRETDFECDFNYVRNADGRCDLVKGATPLTKDTSWEQCDASGVWYERTEWRKVPHSSCVGGDTRDRGTEHPCPGLSAKGFFFWVFMALVAVALTGMFSFCWRRSPYARGTIRLPDRGESGLPLPPHGSSFSDSGALATLASIPAFAFGLAGAAWARISPLFNRLPIIGARRRERGGYRHVAIDEDARVLRFEDEE